VAFYYFLTYTLEIVGDNSRKIIFYFFENVIGRPFFDIPLVRQDISKPKSDKLILEFIEALPGL
jgi:hypothetical protein